MPRNNLIVRGVFALLIVLFLPLQVVSAGTLMQGGEGQHYTFSISAQGDSSPSYGYNIRQFFAYVTPGATADGDFTGSWKIPNGQTVSANQKFAPYHYMAAQGQVVAYGVQGGGVCNTVSMLRYVGAMAGLQDAADSGNHAYIAGVPQQYWTVIWSDTNGGGTDMRLTNSLGHDVYINWHVYGDTVDLWVSLEPGGAATDAVPAPVTPGYVPPADAAPRQPGSQNGWGNYVDETLNGVKYHAPKPKVTFKVTIMPDTVVQSAPSGSAVQQDPVNTETTRTSNTSRDTGIPPIVFVVSAVVCVLGFLVLRATEHFGLSWTCGALFLVSLGLLAIKLTSPVTATPVQQSQPEFRQAVPTVQAAQVAVVQPLGGNEEIKFSVKVRFPTPETPSNASGQPQNGSSQTATTLGPSNFTPFTDPSFGDTVFAGTYGHLSGWGSLSAANGSPEAAVNIAEQHAQIVAGWHSGKTVPVVNMNVDNEDDGTIRSVINLCGQRGCIVMLDTIATDPIDSMIDSYVPLGCQVWFDIDLEHTNGIDSGTLNAHAARFFTARKNAGCKQPAVFGFYDFRSSLYVSNPQAIVWKYDGGIVVPIFDGHCHGEMGCADAKYGQTRVVMGAYQGYGAQGIGIMEFTTKWGCTQYGDCDLVPQQYFNKFHPLLFYKQ